MIQKLTKQNDYELLDSGDGEKLERFGDFIMSRPDPEILWNKSKDLSVWEKSDLKFIRTGNKTKWIIKNRIPKSWNINFNKLNFIIKPTSFKHVGLFPEQMMNWSWMENLIKNEKGKRDINILNLFAYTGGATLACARSGARVCHVDSSKVVVGWARDNAKFSGLEDTPIRWIIEDVISFVKREIKRGKKYDGLIMDPPSFGHGPKDELWKIEKDFALLINLCKELLSDDPLFVLINGYTAGYSAITYENNLKDLMMGFDGNTKSGELVIEETDSGRLLPCGIFARWSRE